MEEQRAALHLKIHRAETGPGRVSLLEVLAALDTAIAEVLEAQTTLQGLGEMGSDVVPALRGRTEGRTMVRSMDTDSREYKIGKQKVSDHPFPNALYAHGMTVKEWAEANGLKREKVRSWFMVGPGGRRIPAVWAERIRKEFKVPLTSWPHGVK